MLRRGVMLWQRSSCLSIFRGPVFPTLVASASTSVSNPTASTSRRNHKNSYPSSSASSSNSSITHPISPAKKELQSFLVSKRSMILKEVRDAIKNNNTNTLLFLLENQVQPLDIHLKLEEYEKIFHMLTRHFKDQSSQDQFQSTIFKIWNYALETDKIKPSLKLYSIFFHALAICAPLQNESIPSIVDWFHKAVKDFPKRNRQTNQILVFCFNELLRLFLKQSSTEEQSLCITLFTQYKSILLLDKISYSIMIQFYAKYGTNHQEAISTLMEEMKSKQFELDSFYFNLLLKSIVERKDNTNHVELLLGIYRQMVEVDKIKPTVHTFQILLQGVSKFVTFQSDLVSKIYKEMQSQQIKGDEPIFNFFIQLLCKEGHFEMALQEVLKQMKFQMMQVYPDTIHIALKRLLKQRKFLLGNYSVEQLLNYFVKPLLHLCSEMDRESKQKIIKDGVTAIKQTAQLSMYSVPKSVDEKIIQLLQQLE